MSLIRPTSILFACNRNAVRSPIAEGLTKHLLGTQIYVDSAGARETKDVDGFAIAVMAELGINIAAHNPKTFDDLTDNSFDLIISLTPEAHHRAIEETRTMACEVEYWAMFDPTLSTGSRAQRLDSFRQVRDSLLRRIKKRFDIPADPVV